METSFIENPLYEHLETKDILVFTQTDKAKREMDSVMNAMTKFRDEIANALGKLKETDKEIAKEKNKLELARSENSKQVK